jgi:hypothetical protein
VDALRGDGTELQTLRLSCIADDAQGERLEILWDAEIGAAVLDEDGWRNVGQGLPDSPEVLAAHLRCRSATAADRDLLQAPFRAGIRPDALPASARSAKRWPPSADAERLDPYRAYDQFHRGRIRHHLVPSIFAALPLRGRS